MLGHGVRWDRSIYFTMYPGIISIAGLYSKYRMALVSFHGRNASGIGGICATKIGIF